MAAPTPYGKLNPAQQKIALAKWHARQDAKTPLSPAQQHKAALAQVVAPGLTQGDLNKIVGADTGLRYGPAETNLRQQPARINAAFAAYKQAINQAGSQLTGSGSQLGGSYGNAVQGVSNLASGLDSLSKDQWAGQQAAMQADATQRGATVDPTLADQAHNASNIRNILTGSFGAQLLAQGQNTRQQYADRGVTAEQQRGETVGAARQKLADLLAEKGAFKVSDAQQIVANTTSNALKSALSAAQLAQSGATTANTNAKTANTQATTAFLKRFGRLPSSTDPNSPTAKLDNARLDYFNKHGYFPPTGPPKKNTATGPASVTPLQKTSRTSDFRKALNNATTYAKAPPKSALAHGWLLKNAAERTSALVSGLEALYPSMNVDILTAAAQKAVYGKVGPKESSALKQLGVDPSYWS